MNSIAESIIPYFFKLEYDEAQIINPVKLTRGGRTITATLLTKNGRITDLVVPRIDNVIPVCESFTNFNK